MVKKNKKSSPIFAILDCPFYCSPRTVPFPIVIDFIIIYDGHLHFNLCVGSFNYFVIILSSHSITNLPTILGEQISFGLIKRCSHRAINMVEGLKKVKEIGGV